MKYIIMCGGKYEKWHTPRHLYCFRGEQLVRRTIRLLRENNIDDIAISASDSRFNSFGVPVLHHENSYVSRNYNDFDGYWCDAFYHVDEPVCYVFGDVVFSDEAIKKIVETDTDDIEFFASAPPFSDKFLKPYAEPFALKVVNNQHLVEACKLVKQYDKEHKFLRKPIMWELWQVIKNTPLNVINYHNYTAINDYTCDIDEPGDINILERIVTE